MSQNAQIDDLMEVRQEIRLSRKLVSETRAAHADAKSKLSAATARLEDILTQIEQQQGVLPFDPDAGKSKGRPESDNAE